MKQIRKIYDLVHKLAEDRDILWNIANDPRISFGTSETFRFLMAQFLPNRITDTNVVNEELTKGLEVIADDGEEMSPPQIKERAAGLPVVVKYGHNDLAQQVDAKTVQLINELLSGNDTAGAESVLARWMVRALRTGLEIKAEVQRCEAIALGQVTIKNKEGAKQVVSYNRSNDFRENIPSGTTAAPLGIYNPATNPVLEYLVPYRDAMVDRGYQPRAIITSNRIARGFQSHPLVQQTYGGIVINASGNLETIIRTSNASFAALNSYLAANGLPPVITYDRFYPDQLGRTKRYFPEDRLVIIGATNRTEELYWTNPESKILTQELIEDTLGYYGIGISPGEDRAGAVINLSYSELKPKGTYGETYRNGFPVLLDQEAITEVTIPARAAA